MSIGVFRASDKSPSPSPALLIGNVHAKLWNIYYIARYFHIFHYQLTTYLRS